MKLLLLLLNNKPKDLAQLCRKVGQGRGDRGRGDSGTQGLKDSRNGGLGNVGTEGLGNLRMKGRGDSGNRSSNAFLPFV